MNKNTVLASGWLVAALFAGMMLGGGFTPQAEKTGVVDLADVVARSQFGKGSEERFRAMRVQREGLLEFMNTYRIMTVEQATKLRDLSLKETSAAEKADLDKLKEDIKKTDAKNTELSTKTTQLTAEERALMQQYGTQAQQIGDLAQRWAQEFTNDLEGWVRKQDEETVKRVRDAVNEVARAQGYSVVFDARVAPYGANNLTENVVKAMDAKS